MYPDLSNIGGRGSFNLIDLAISEIYESYGHRVKVGRKSLLKFGRAPDIPTINETEVNTLNRNETYPSGNLITHISSSNAGDTNLIIIEGMQLVGGVYVFASQNITLAGRTKTALTTPLIRVTRAYNFDTTDLLGDVYIYENVAITNGVPNDLVGAHLKILAVSGQSEKAAASIADNNYFIQTKMYAYINKKQAASANIRVRTRQFGKAFRTTFVGSLSTTGKGDIVNLEEPYRIIRPNSDISITAECSVTGVDISAGFSGFFADIV